MATSQRLLHFTSVGHFVRPEESATKRPIAEIKSAKKRALAMGAYSAWRRGYNSHPLAACIDNYTTALDEEMHGAAPRCYLNALWCILKMAQRINAYCDGHKVVGDVAAQYWLERFLWRVDVVLAFDKLQGEK